MFEFEIKILEFILAERFVTFAVFVSSWVVDLFGFLAAFETCPFWVLIKIIVLYLQTHRYHWNQTPVFFFFFLGGLGIKG